MKTLLLSIAAVASGFPAVHAGAAGFYDHWGDGRAELSSYRIEQPRYGEQRAAYGVLIFVTEELNRHTRVKVESPTPDSDRIYVLKLNNVLKFNTGIYDYAVMTSVFSAVEPVRGGAPFELQKLSLSSQEWCGHVFEEVHVDPDEVRGDLNSYFEREGRHQWRFDRPADFESEDHLLIRIRELNGEWLRPGETRSLTMLPSLWTFRQRHEPRALVPATITKGASEEIAVAGEELAAIRWSWDYGNGPTVTWVEEAAPHRILAWRDAAGGAAELMRTIRVPYWSLNANADESYREQLGIP